MDLHVRPLQMLSLLLFLSMLGWCPRISHSIGIASSQVLLSGSSGRASSRFCRYLKGMSTKQVAICRESLEYMASVLNGANMAIKECRSQFKWNRWNCSVPESDKGSIFERVTNKGTKESAFTYALSSAGVVYSIARACVTGDLRSCACSRERRPKELDSGAQFNPTIMYEWGGCGDNIEHGRVFAKKFVDAGENVHDDNKARVLMNLHNNEAGREAVLSMSEIKCKCHGVSAACSVYTCWRQLKDFTVIGDHLRSRYDTAMQVSLRKRSGRLLSKRARRNGPRKNTKPDVRDLVYLFQSPNYCTRNLAQGSEGTRGRICNTTTIGESNCRRLCCDRGYDVVQMTETRRCSCKFKWCCYVVCKQCTEVVARQVCK